MINVTQREFVHISQGAILINILCILYVDNHNTQCNKPNNHTMLFFKWQSFPKKFPGKLVPIFQGVILDNVPFIYDSVLGKRGLTYLQIWGK